MNPRDHRAYYYRAIYYADNATPGDYEKAILDYTKAIEINPGLSEAYQGRGATYYKKGQYDRAILDFTKAIEIDARYDTAYERRSLAYCIKGEWDKAWEDIQRAQSLGSKLPPALLKIIHEGLEGKTVGQENVKVLREIVFLTYHDSVSKGLNETPNIGQLYPGQKIEFRIEKASEFELGMYLLARLDWQIYYCKQKESVRRALFDSCMKSILPSDDKRFVDLVYHRLDVYGEIFNRIKEAGGNWADYKMKCDNWLINAILYSENDYGKMTAEEMPLVILPFTQRVPIELAFSSIECTLLVMFDCILKHVFANNNDFTLLSEEDLLNRMEEGSKEGSSIVEKHNK